MVALLLLSSGWLARGALIKQHSMTLQQQTALDQARLPMTATGSGANPLPAHAQPALNPSEWPTRAEVDAVVQLAGETAQAQGVTLRSLTVSHQAASTQAWGQVTLDASTSGSYAALKTWQDGMQQAFPSLAVRSLRLQAAPAGGEGGLDAQSTWVLHVRD
jgi:hypothetical protein